MEDGGWRMAKRGRIGRLGRTWLMRRSRWRIVLASGDGLWGQGDSCGRCSCQMSKVKCQKFITSIDEDEFLGVDQGVGQVGPGARVGEAVRGVDALLLGLLVEEGSDGGG